MVKIDTPRMEITLVSTTGRTKMVFEHRLLEQGIQSAYFGEIIAIILSDLVSDRFMQTAGASCIECSEDHTCYYTTNTSKTQAVVLFKMFAEGDKQWKSSADWKTDIELTKAVYGDLSGTQLIDLTNSKIPQIKEMAPLSSFPVSEDTVRESFEKFKRTMSECERKVIAGEKVFRWSWNCLTSPIKIIGDGYIDALWMQYPNLFAEGKVDEVAKEAYCIALRMEELYLQQMLKDLLREPIISVPTTKRMLRETHMVDDFLENSNELHPLLLLLLRQTKERLAWCRAKKKIDEADVLKAADRTIKSASCRKEAQVLLQQDWQWVFINEQCPTLDKKPQ